MASELPKNLATDDAIHHALISGAAEFDLQRQSTATEARFETICVHTLVRRTNKVSDFSKDFGGAARI